MSEEHKKTLEQQLWNIANTLRGKMGADEFRDYILGFIFYKYLSEKMELYANTILKEDGIKYHDIKEATQEGKEYIEAIKEEALEKLGYFLKPSELFSALVQRGNGNGKEEQEEEEKENKKGFILKDLQDILNNIQLSTMGTASEEDFDHLFEDIDLNSTKLGKSAEARNQVISKVLSHLNKIDFKLESTELDVLGDAYEYLIAQFASGAGKKAGEFYTPQEVSRVLAKIVTTGKTKLKSVYDPTCGSGSLLLRVAKEVKEVSAFYGQEQNRTTYNLARMNMILHDVHYRKFDIKQEDTLERPQHLGKEFEAIVANPPFSAKWSANPLFMSDDRFSQYGRLAPAGKADFAFVQHMIHHLAENGIMAIVLPHGALFRTGAEQNIRRHLIEEKNYLDAVIGLPVNIFYGTEIPTCIMVFKKCREYPENILFIDASNEFGTFKTQNILRKDDIDKIIRIYRNRNEEDRYSKVVPLAAVKDNDFNLNISQYINSFLTDDVTDVAIVANYLEKTQDEIDQVDGLISSYCKELNIAEPKGSNIRYLRQYRKSIMHNLFSKKNRFRDSQGNNYPDWETKKLKDVFKRKTLKNRDGKITRVLTNSATKGIVNQDEYFDKNIANQANLAGYYIVEINDFVYNPRISQSAPVGPLKRNRNFKGVMSPLYTILECNIGNLDFFEVFFETDFWHPYMRSIANYGARHDRMNITKAGLENMPLPFPDEKEQEKIAKFVLSIDRKIKLISE